MAAKTMLARKVRTKANVEAEPGRFAGMLGFGLVLLPMAAAVATLMLQAPPPKLHVEAVAEQKAAPLPRQYLELPDPLSVAVTPKGPRMQMVLAFAVRAEMAQLLPLKDAVAAKGNVILASMLTEAQVMVRDGADSEALHRNLPEKLRKVINDALGTPEWPEPVEEVLITSAYIQQ